MTSTSLPTPNLTHSLYQPCDISEIIELKDKVIDKERVIRDLRAAIAVMEEEEVITMQHNNLILLLNI